MIIKICGLRREADIEAANEVRPDLVGFVFAKKSPRYVPPEQAEKLREMLSPGIRTAGVFTDEKPENIAALLGAGVIDFAQLHGFAFSGAAEGPAESAESRTDRISREILALKAMTDRPVIRAYRIETAQDIEEANNSPADRILLDHGAGGTGDRFDWSLLQGMKRPFILAGGLDPDNVREAIRAAGPMLCGVDVSSGVETDGYKDPEKMRRFVEAVQAGISGKGRAGDRKEV